MEFLDILPRKFPDISSEQIKKLWDIIKICMKQKKWYVSYNF